jgi:TolB protein
MKRELPARCITASLLFAATIACAIDAHAQDRFKAVRLTSDPALEGFATWSPDGASIVYSRIAERDSCEKTGLWRVSPDGSRSAQVFSGLAEHPQWSPDGRHIVFDADSGKSIKIIPAKGGTPTGVVPDTMQIKDGGTPCWSPDGSQIAFLERGTMSLCVASLKTGQVARIFQKEGMMPIPGCWSRDGGGILVALMDRQTRKSTLWEISSDGREKKRIPGHHEGLYRHLALSPDGSLLVYAALEGRYLGLWIMPAKGGRSIPFVVSHPGHNESASWSPDGRRLAFTSTRSGNFDIWMMDVDVELIQQELKALN